MNHSAATLDTFFKIDEIPKATLSEILKSDDFKPVKKNISKEIKSITLPNSFFAKMIQKVSDLLKIDVHAILLNAWAKSGELGSYLENNKTPEDTIIIPLADHSIKSVHTPSIKPVINNISLGTIKFSVYLELLVKGAILEVQDKKIKSLSIGSCSAKGSVGYDAFIIAEKEGEIPMRSTSINLGEGIPLNEPVENIHNTLEAILENPQNIAQA